MDLLDNINIKMFGATLLPLVGTSLIKFITGTKIDKNWINNLNRPSLIPPDWVFPVVWTYLYLSMGYASFLVYQSGGEKLNGVALFIYIVHLFVNWSWSPIYFGQKKITLAFYIIIILWIGVLSTMIAFFTMNTTAGLLIVPYFAWTSFASFLNYRIMILNEKPKAQ
ncbi:tryptophan-rich sensory protein [Lepeophtheirus salmonis]|uniref:tryptophan-rich sensory protein n=1 Tax=Lepeophtheirus salmonis TaxID=72036 RepID=UPI001AE4AC6F|nr:tryptophan-rich sensory protein-like [Lepeophtheirus salmonis]